MTPPLWSNPFGLDEDQAAVARGIIAGLSWDEIGIICGWSASKVYLIAREVARIVGCKRGQLKVTLDLADLPQPVVGYLIRWWSTNRCGKVDTGHIGQLPPLHTTKKKRKVMTARRATVYSVKQPIWWAGLSPGDIVERAGSLDEPTLIDAGKEHGYTVSRVVNDDGSPIIGKAAYGVSGAPPLNDRLVLALSGGRGSKYVRVDVFVEAFGLDPEKGVAEILNSTLGDSRIARGTVQDRTALRLAE